MTGQLLIIEDDADVSRALERTLSHVARATHVAQNMQAAISELKRSVFDVVLVDLGLPDREGLDVLDAVFGQDPNCRVVVVTGRNDARLAARAVQRGAVDYLVKPWDRSALLDVVGRALDDVRVRRDAVSRDEGPVAHAAESRSVGRSPQWLRTLDALRDAAARSRAPVLISGESGTGKDVAGALVHRWSNRSAGPLVTLNAACLPPSLLESELFGHEAGAFTGARTARKGLFELASGGVLFLDEIAELPFDLQPKLLRVLDGYSFRRLGGEREIPVDVRLVAATNRDLPALVAAGRFREDLYYRLRVLEFRLPPLREREGDVRELATHFAHKLAREYGYPSTAIADDALTVLERYHWPGNVREVRNVIERALVLAHGRPIDRRHLEGAITARPPSGETSNARLPSPAPAVSESRGRAVDADAPHDRSLLEAVRIHVLAVYESTGKNVSRTAQLLRISRVALRKKLRDFGAYEAPNSRL